jgi:hypothetical protein
LEITIHLHDAGMADVVLVCGTFRELFPRNYLPENHPKISDRIYRIHRIQKPEKSVNPVHPVNPLQTLYQRAIARVLLASCLEITIHLHDAGMADVVLVCGTFRELFPRNYLPENHPKISDRTYRIHRIQNPEKSANPVHPVNPLQTLYQRAIARILLASCLEITIHLHDAGMADVVLVCGTFRELFPRTYLPENHPKISDRTYRIHRIQNPEKSVNPVHPVNPVQTLFVPLLGQYQKLPPCPRDSIQVSSFRFQPFFRAIFNGLAALYFHCHADGIIKVKWILLQSNIRLLALFAFALALHLCGTWILPLVDRDEPRFSEASREMRERGDWILPTFNNQPRYDKPPLTYWCQIIAYKIFGENDFAARFHSALFTALTTLVVYGFCTRLHNPSAGWRAALAFTLSLQVMIQSKAAVADMPMVFFVTVAAWAGWELISKPSRAWWWIFYIALALGFLAKGPIAWLPAGGVLLCSKWLRTGAMNRNLKFQYGIPLMLALVAVWGVPALEITQGEFFNVGIGKHVLQRSFAPMEGHGGGGALTYIAMLPFYFVTIFASFFPWTIFSRQVFLRIKERRTQADVYLLSGIILTFGIFTLVKTKLPHYTLPAFPLLACLVAPQLEALPVLRFGRLAAGMAVLNLALAFIAFPWLASCVLLPIKQTSASIKLPPETEFASVGYNEPSQIWYFRRHVKTWYTPLQPDEVENFMSKPGPRLCVLPPGIAKTVPHAAPWDEQNFHGKDIANGRNMTLTLVFKR